MSKHTVQDSESECNREERLKQEVCGCLDQLSADNVDIIVARLLQVDMRSIKRMYLVASCVNTKVFSEFNKCAVYADVVDKLRIKCPKFPPLEEGQSAITFYLLLLNAFQSEYEDLPKTFVATDEEQATFSPRENFLRMEKRKDKLMACIRFMGQLCLRRLLAPEVIGRVLHDLIGGKKGRPEEFLVECACDLIEIVGRHLDGWRPLDGSGSSRGDSVMRTSCAGLADLAMAETPDGACAFSKRVVDNIEVLLDLRSRGWATAQSCEFIVLQCAISRSACKEDFRVTCTAVNGEEQCELRCGSEESIASLLRGIARELNTANNRFRSVLPDGRCLEILSPSMCVSDLSFEF